MNEYEHLSWDSDFFGFKIAKIKIDRDFNQLQDLLNKLKHRESYKLVYVFTKDEILNLDFIDKYNGKLVDRKVTYSKYVNENNLISLDFINKYQSGKVDSILIDLAIQSGEFSRFKIDDKIETDKFEELYQLWVRNSIDKKIAKEVFVYSENEILGFITVGVKNEKANIGLIAVDHNARGKGIGKKLMVRAERWAVNTDYNEIQVVTQGNNKSACNFYENCGYSIVKTEFIYHFWL
ncbi:GNAT family N-acetyltransferase [Aureibaculum sp. A20]|uniref:GNAT family N-acetyltransferase n=1 Tax=Aureibaculum flavum TaxID=2795986 RepID=A0ABS0WRM1_9FLAO|nr:GNAT family N-acetyltransferase [Aureibaculum flavum]MBJ2174576.1 GNAT family N-acetyltransferase [Aureibaculum flavum]